MASCEILDLFFCRLWICSELRGIRMLWYCRGHAALEISSLYICFLWIMWHFLEHRRTCAIIDLAISWVTMWTINCSCLLIANVLNKHIFARHFGRIYESILCVSLEFVVTPLWCLCNKINFQDDWLTSRYILLVSIHLSIRGQLCSTCYRLIILC